MFEQLMLVRVVAMLTLEHIPQHGETFLLLWSRLVETDVYIPNRLGFLLYKAVRQKLYSAFERLIVSLGKHSHPMHWQLEKNLIY